MRSGALPVLVEAVEARFGPIRRHGGDPDDEHHMSFTPAGVPASFSVHTREGELPDGWYDVQIEHDPPWVYVYTELVAFSEFLMIAHRVRTCPVAEWPSSDEGRPPVVH